MDYVSLARPPVRQLEPYSAGTTTDQAKRRFALDRVIKLSSNENPRGSSPKALAAIAATNNDAHLYADDDHLALRARLSEPYGLRIENTILGHGSNEILLMFFLTFVGAGDEVVMADPTFSLFPADAIVTGATPVRVPLRDGVHDLEAMLAAVNARTKAVIICDPNNPSGTCVDPEAFAHFTSLLPPNVLLFIDQAYREYMPAASVEGTDYVKSRRGTIVTRTMSKLYGLASVRFGYGFADQGMIDLMQRVRVPFNVSSPAARAAAAALDDAEFRAATIALNAEQKEYLEAAFRRLGLFAYPSAANFIAVRVPVAADVAYTDLLRRGLIVRSGDKLGLPNFLRITIGLPEQNQALVAALEAGTAGVAGARTGPRMSAAIAIRRGTVRDRAFVVDLGRRVSPTSVSSLRVALAPLVEGAYERLVEYVLAREHDILVADVDGAPRGFALLIYDLPDEITLTEQTFIAYMAVEPEWQRRGIATLLLAQIEDQARKRGLPYLSLMVTEENTPALALYDKSGFSTERRMMTKAL